MAEARRIRAADRRPGPATSGMTREEAIASGGLWSGFVRTAPGAVTGWHHHGTHETSIFVVSGRFDLETADGVLDGEPGDFFHVPPGVVHREANPGADESHVVVVRFGTGNTVFNVDGP